MHESVTHVLNNLLFVDTDTCSLEDVFIEIPEYGGNTFGLCNKQLDPSY